MKKHIIFALSIFLFSACSKDDSNDNLDKNPNSQEIGTLKVKVDGTEFESTTALCLLTELSPEKELLTLNAQDASSSSSDIVTIYFYVQTANLLELQNYESTPSTCDPSINTCMAITFTNGETFDISSSNDEDGSSSLTLTSIDYRAGGHVSGTFSATLESATTDNTITMTEGQFSASIL